MIIRAIEFVQHEGKPLEWRIEGFTLQPINLIVGRNASGKSKALRLIDDLGRLVSGRTKPRSATGSYVAHFNGDAAKTTYTLRVSDARVAREELVIGGKTKLSRGDNGAGEIYFDQLGKDLDFQSPDTDLACVTRRDSIQHPYLDEIHAWGSSTLHYRFNSLDLGKHSALMLLSNEMMIDHGLPIDSSSSVHRVYFAGVETFDEKYRSSIVRDMRELDYPLEGVGVKQRDGDVLDPAREQTTGSVSLYVREEGLGVIDQFEMSDGMFRALSILIQVNYAAMSGSRSCVLIDDIGEGLDYEQSCKLIKLLIDKAKSSGIQLVMTTNDRFVMNNVPLEHWSVLVRKSSPGVGTTVKVYNYQNHKEIFDQFALTGMNNFDFFATGFFEEGFREDE